MPEPTPGQVNYEAYWQRLCQHSPRVRTPWLAWSMLAATERAAWEAAAQALYQAVYQEKERLMHADDGVLLAEGLWALRRELVLVLHAPAPNGWIAMEAQERQQLTSKLARIDALLTRMGEPPHA